MYRYTECNRTYIRLPLSGEGKKRVWLSASDIMAVEYEAKNKCTVIMKNERAYLVDINGDELINTICKKEG